ncbi:MAG TPA: sigma-70 family RNA polymerase sigma factor [Polyangiaceae bacterium]|nr:sigma-70 family RNA polymerase sigma factor [Polyangiaceae bacterium]
MQPATEAQLQKDVALMRRAALGDPAARREAVVRVLPRARRLCQSLLGSASDSEDASQMGIVEVLRSAAHFRGECPLEHWASRIVARTALRMAKDERRKARMSAAFLAEGEEDAVEAEYGPSRILATECLKKLPEVQRTALLLRCGFEYSIEEIAELTQVSRNTVKDRLLRARESLRDLLRQNAESDQDPTIPGSARLIR